MLNNKYVAQLIFLLLLSCNKDNPAEFDSNQNIEIESVSVTISQITYDKNTVSTGDIIKLECIATASDSLHYHWSLEKGNTVYKSDIIDKENASATFDFGKWIKWNPSGSGTWTIEVLAYLSEADHSSQGVGTWQVYYEYNSSGELIHRHCFNNAEKGELWDIMSITKSVSSIGNYNKKIELTLVETYTLNFKMYRGLAWGDGYIWGSHSSHNDSKCLPDTIFKLDPNNWVIVDKIIGPGSCSNNYLNGFAFDNSKGGPYIWISEDEENVIYKINADDFNVVDTIQLSDEYLDDLGWDGKNLWCLATKNDKIYKIDPASGSIISAFGTPDIWNESSGLAVDTVSSGNPYVWLANSLTRQTKYAQYIYQIDAISGTLINKIESPERYNIEGLAFDNDSPEGPFLWILGWKDEHKIFKMKIDDSI